MRKCGKTAIYFLFFILVVIAVKAETSTIFVIPGEYTYVPSFSSLSFDSTGNHTINITLYLKDVVTLEQNLTNSAIINGTITHPSSITYDLNFTNTGADGLYNWTYDFNETGTYIMNLTMFNATYGSVTTSQTISVGISSYNLTLTTSQSSYAKSESAEATLNVTDGVGNAQESGTAEIMIVFEDGSLWLDWTAMTELGSGVYYYPFGAPDVIGTYNLTANFTKSGTSNVTTIQFTITDADSSTGPGGSGGADRWQYGGDGEIRYDITPDHLDIMVISGQEVHKGMIIKNLGLDTLVVDISTDLKTIPEYKTLGIAPNDQQEIKFVISNFPLGTYDRQVNLKFSNNKGNTIEDNYTISFEVISPREDGEYCFNDADCKSKKCRENVCQSSIPIIDDVAESTKGNPVVFAVLGLLLLIALISVIYNSMDKNKKAKYDGVEAIKKDYFIIFGREVNKKILFASIGAGLLLLIFIPLMLLNAGEKPSEIDVPQPIIVNKTTDIKYEVFPRIINTKFDMNLPEEVSFKITNLEDSKQIITNLHSNLEIYPKTFAIQPGGFYDVVFNLTGPAGNYTRSISLNLLTLDGLKTTDEVTINYEIEAGEPIEVPLAQSFASKHPEMFLIIALILVIALITVLVIEFSKEPQKQKLKKVFNLKKVMDVLGKDINGKILLIAIVAIIIIVSGVFFLNSLEDKGAENTGFVSEPISNYYVAPSYIKYDVAPRGIANTLLMGESYKGEVLIKNLDMMPISILFDSQLEIYPISMTIPPDEERTLTYVLNGPIGNFEGDINLKISNNVFFGDSALTDKVLVKYAIVQGKNIGESCLIDAECYSKNCEDVCEPKNEGLVETKEQFKTKPEFFFVTIAILLIAMGLIVWVQGSVKNTLAKRLLTVAIIVIMLTSCILFFYSSQEPKSEEISSVPKVMSVMGDKIQYEVLVEKFDEVKLNSDKEVELVFHNLESDRITIKLDTDLYVSPRNFLVEPESEKKINLLIQGPVGDYKKEINILASHVSVSESKTLELDYQITDGEPQGYTSLSDWLRNNRMILIFIIGVVLFILVVIILSQVSVKGE